MSTKAKIRYKVIGHFCPTERNPETEADKDVSEMLCGSQEEAEALLLWYPDGKIVKVRERRRKTR